MATNNEENERLWQEDGRVLYARGRDDGQRRRSTETDGLTRARIRPERINSSTRFVNRRGRNVRSNYGVRTVEDKEQYLKSLVQKDASDIILELLSPRSLLRELVEGKQLSKELVPTLLVLIGKGSTCSSMPRMVSQSFALVLQSPFLLTETARYITRVQTSLHVTPDLSMLRPCIALASFLREVLTSIPNSYTSVASIITNLECLSNLVGKEIDQKTKSTSTAKEGDESNETTLRDKATTDTGPPDADIWGRFQTEIELLMEQKILTEALIRDESHNLVDEGSQPTDFRHMSIYPTQDEISGMVQPFLRANKYKGKYANVKMYLDTQFRLLREDFTGPLRESVAEYVRMPGQTGRLQSGRVYRNVRIGSEVIGRRGISHEIKFDASQFQHVHWETSKRLMFGSLVCLSSDNFRNFSLAYISQRDPSDLEEGTINVQFFDFNEDQLLTADHFVMIETTSYFEAYRPVLKALQEIREDEFPFSKYIVDCNMSVTPPAYLSRLEDTRYDIAPLTMEPEDKREVLLNELKTQTDLQLDDSQAQAISNALSNEFVVIQGPPGTGKTYLGLKIVEVLLKNRPLWNEDFQENPILVVCYTNHALDQFLEGIGDFFKGRIIRVGGRSKNDKIDKYLLKNHRSFSTAEHTDVVVRNLHHQVLAIEERLKTCSEELEIAETKILPLSTMDAFITEEQRLSFLNHKSGTGNTVRVWLGLPFDNDSFPRHFETVANGILDLNLYSCSSVDKRNIGLLRETRQMIISDDAMSEEERTSVANFWRLTTVNRWRLYRYWRNIYHTKLQRLVKYYQMNGFRLAFDETNSRIEALYRGVVSVAYLQGIDNELQVCTQKYRGKVPFLVSWLGLGPLYRILGVGPSDINFRLQTNASYMFAFLPLRAKSREIASLAYMVVQKLNEQDYMEEDEVVAAESVEDLYDLSLEQRWRLYRSWRNKLFNILSSCSLSRDGFWAEHTETTIKLECLFSGIIHERYLGEITTFWMKDNYLHYNTEKNESELLHWLCLTEACPCMHNENKPTASFIRHANSINIEDASTRRFEQQEYTGEERQTFKIGRRKGESLEKLEEIQIQADDIMTPEEVQNVTNVWLLPVNQRWRLYRHWKQSFTDQLQNELDECKRDYSYACQAKNECDSLADVGTMQRSAVLGMTTNCAAKYRAALERVKPRIVIVEEAAEVLEAHIVTTLSENCQQLILIGDHKQLRPNPNVYDLAKKYNLEISLFERMINNGIVFNCLNVQHRMRPEIASLMEPIYPGLRNHGVVYSYEDIKGISCNVYFIDHTEPETDDEELVSKSNEHEATFIASLCKYLLQQGYRGEQITILTMYTGQLLRIKRAMKQLETTSRFAVRISAVDNFQGEENDIVLLSLVRSNNDGKIGFLKSHNRITVALSRAKKGLYVIGNFSLLATSDRFWNATVEKMKTNGKLGKSLLLCCQNHSKNTIQVSTAEDFRNCPEGGCLEPCDTKLSCGHRCALFCHVYDQEHNMVTCEKRCDAVLCSDGHQCPKICHDGSSCGKCNFRLEKTIPQCGHKIKMLCHLPPENVPCPVTCEKVLPSCGHLKEMPCSSDTAVAVCEKEVEKCIPLCGHIQKMKCTDVPENIQCRQSCNRLCKMGHKCSKMCYEECGNCTALVDKTMPNCGHVQSIACFKDPDEVICEAPCSKCCPLAGHRCQQLCYEPCKPCEVRVEKVITLCGHTQGMKCHEDPKSIKCKNVCGKIRPVCGHKCLKQCNKKCGKCSVKVQKKMSSCNHSVEVKCSNLQNPTFCKEKCERRLKCGHVCASLCSDECDQICQVEVDKTIPTCGHSVKATCSLPAESKLCQKPCTHCVHKCTLVCGSRCQINCREILHCVLECGHSSKVECRQTKKTEEGDALKCLECSGKMRKITEVALAKEVYTPTATTSRAAKRRSKRKFKTKQPQRDPEHYRRGHNYGMPK